MGGRHAKLSTKEPDQDKAWSSKHILSVINFNSDEIQQILDLAGHYKSSLTDNAGDHHHDDDENLRNVGKGKIMSCLFYEPSTRTNCSFTAAMYKLGGNVMQINATESSVKKGESLEDTVKCLECYSDLIVMRHPGLGSVAKAASALTSSRIINAGDGIGEHPTQALLDLFTIIDETKHTFPWQNNEVKDEKDSAATVHNLTVTFVGDLKNGRTVHSLAKCLSIFFCSPKKQSKNFMLTLNYVSPRILKVPADVLKFVGDQVKSVEHSVKIVQNIYETLDEENCIGASDVLYVTRVQKERFESEADYNQVKDSFIITKDVMAKAKATCVLMHPLPRINEISAEVDDDARAAYFRQMKNGLYVRMSLITLMLKKN